MATIRRVTPSWGGVAGAARRAPAAALLAALIASAPVAGQCPDPSVYYAGVDASSRAALIEDLHDLIDDHTRVMYDSSASTDTWDVLEAAEEDPVDSGWILDIYKNARYEKVTSSRPYQREHSWPKSYGFPLYKKDAHGNTLPTGVHNYPYTDCHALFLAYGSYNASRSNRPYVACQPCSGEDCNCQPQQTDENYGQGGDTGMTYPGWANWRTLSPDSRGIWETWMGRRGDVARAQFYMDVRYEHEMNSSGEWEPDLRLIDDAEAVKASSDSSANHSEGLMGVLSDLLVWHHEDPVDAIEANRHQVVCGHQENRNPFVDRPGYAYCAFLDWCQPDLWLTKDDGVVEVAPGETLTYTLEAGSADDMIGATVTDVFDPLQFDTTSVSWTCSPAPAADPFTTCPPSGSGTALAAGVPITLKGGDFVRFTVTAPLLASASGTVANTASVAPPLGLSDPSPGDNQATDLDQVPATGGCGSPDVWDLSGRIVEAAQTFEACTSLVAGDFTVRAPAGDATLRAGVSITLGEDFRVETDCELTGEIDPSLVSL